MHKQNHGRFLKHAVSDRYIDLSEKWLDDEVTLQDGRHSKSHIEERRVSRGLEQTTLARLTQERFTREED